jgi:DUF4097 and DUF4098 domain-containing protein YvlB
MRKHLCLTFFSILLITPYCTAKFSLRKKLKYLFEYGMKEHVDQKEFPVDELSSLSVANHHGSITIKTGPKKSLFLRATKRTRKSSFDDLEVLIEHTTHQIKISSRNNNKKKSGSIDYELIVPAFFNLNLTLTGKGDIFIKDVQGIIDIDTQDKVTLMNTKKLASIQTHKKGSVLITNAYGPLRTRTHKGAIKGENIAHNFHAHSISGNIDILYKKLPSTSTIDARTSSGNITLSLPTQTHATICGNTLYGTIICDHEITLAPYTTKLNRSAWKQFTKQVDGVLGTGGSAIALNSTQGNIKIVDIS